MLFLRAGVGPRIMDSKHGCPDLTVSFRKDAEERSMPVTSGHGGIEAASLRSQIDILLRVEALFEIPSYDHSDAETFRVLVGDAVEHGRLDREAVAAHFKISQGTLSRWIQGRNVPHQLARSVVTQDLLLMLKEKRAGQEKRLAELEAADADADQATKQSTGQSGKTGIPAMAGS